MVREQNVFLSHLFTQLKETNAYSYLVQENISRIEAWFSRFNHSLCLSAISITMWRFPWYVTGFYSGVLVLKAFYMSSLAHATNISGTERTGDTRR